MRSQKITSAAAILSLALGTGSCLAAFQIVNALLLRPLPIAHPDRLYSLTRWDYRSPIRDSWQPPVLQSLRDAVANRAELIAISEAERVEITFRADPEMERALVQYVSGDLFKSFQLRPATGRVLSEGDDHPVAVLSHDYWSRRFARDPTVVGRTFRMTNNLTGTRIYQIVGVAGAGFTGTEPGKVVDIFLPAAMHWGIAYPEWSVFRGFVHLRPGESPSGVRDLLRANLRALNQARGNRINQQLDLEAAGAGVSTVQKDYSVPLTALCVLIALVLLTACANVANLMLAQTAARAREIALRISIGAGPRRVGQLILSEAAIVGLLSTVLGAAFARWAAPFVLSRVNPPDNPARLALSLDWRALAFTLLLTLCVTLLFGLAPALRASAMDPAGVLKGGSTPHSRGQWMRILIASQAAFCFIVLFAAGLFVATFDHLYKQQNGFVSDRILNIDVVNPTNEPSVLWDQLMDHLRDLPGVQSIAYADWPLLDGRSFKTDAISVEGQPPSEIPAWFMNVSPAWFSAMEIPFLAGRDFSRTDLSPGVAVINQAFARQFFAQQNPLGRSFTGTSGWMKGQRFQIVGVVADARYRGLRERVLPIAYTPFRRNDDRGTMQGGTVIVRTTTANPLALASILRREIPSARPEFRVSNIRTQQELIESQTVRERLLATLARFFGVVALLLAGVGLYGVLNYSVLQRRREIGIRTALGAQPQELAAVLTARYFWALLIGSTAGCAFSLASVRYIEPLLYQVRPGAPSTILGPAVAITSVAVVASLPAIIRALTIDPADLLRTD